MKKYTIGLITGALLAVSTMMFMGAQNNDVEQDIVALKTDIADLEDDFNSNRRKTSISLSEVQQAITLLQTDIDSLKGAVTGRYQFMTPIISTVLMLDTRDATTYYLKGPSGELRKPGGQWIRISPQEPFK